MAALLSGEAVPAEEEEEVGMAVVGVGAVEVTAAAEVAAEEVVAAGEEAGEVAEEEA